MDSPRDVDGRPRPSTPSSTTLHVPGPRNLRRQPSSSSFHVTPPSPSLAAVTTTTRSTSLDATPTASSSASSVQGVEPAMVNETGAIVISDGDDQSADVEGEVKAAEGDTNQALKEQLRKSLSRKDRDYIRSHDNREDVTDVPHDLANEFPPRQYFVLTNAGKPVFISRGTTPAEPDDDLTNAVGVMQAIISVFADDDDKIRFMDAGRTRITFFLRSPLYYVCVSSWREPESVTRLHLEYLHYQILSVVTHLQLSRIFERRNNFDLGRLLDGSERFLYSLLGRLENDIGIIFACLSALRLDPGVRVKAGDALVPPKDMRDVLYVGFVAADKVVTLVRPKKLSIYPADLHILLNTVSSPSLQLAPASWLPICLPKYNPDRFLYTYVSFLKGSTTGAESDGGTDANLGLVIVSPDREAFERIRGWANAIETSLSSAGILSSILSAVRSHEYSTSDLRIPGLRHFVYKSRSLVQLTVPKWEDPYDDVTAKRRLITLYQILHDAIHAKSGQPEGPLKLQYLRTKNESVMGWITQPFELYITLSPLLPKSAVVSAANAVAKWVKKEEAKLFLKDAPVF